MTNENLNALDAYAEATMHAARMCAAYVACTDDSAAPVVWEAYEEAMTAQRATRNVLAASLAQRAGVDVARVIL